MKPSESNPYNIQASSLWSGLIKGDKSGLEGIYRLFCKELFLYGVSIIDNENLVEDCIQEVFIDLWKYHKNLQKAENVKMYLFRALTYKMFGESKKERKWNFDNIEEHILLSPSRESEIVSGERDRQVQEQIALVISKLPFRQKEVINYLFFENFSYEEISKIMGINLRSVYTLAWKAISAMKKKLGNHILVFFFLFIG
ncbi:RNA polymerase sigma factor [Echinicola salinicaeni]|uniref:RNA polymerase sigma factor n=1 Tax=Echinicola salinicaeni TaxID=2762757 RepID=UPI001647C0A8|nr:sigma-70 family RNA polymerase sigma factor [Echinicola salinicaeni]